MCQSATQSDLWNLWYMVTGGVRSWASHHVGVVHKQWSLTQPRMLRDAKGCWGLAGFNLKWARSHIQTLTYTFGLRICMNKSGILECLVHWCIMSTPGNKPPGCWIWGTILTAHCYYLLGTYKPLRDPTPSTKTCASRMAHRLRQTSIIFHQVEILLAHRRSKWTNSEAGSSNISIYYAFNVSLLTKSCQPYACLNSQNYHPPHGTPSFITFSTYKHATTS